ncbi:DUF3987 domain-containing protein [Aquamicrobium soli]|uniref:DUF3987 domain-containing protein n=1 Tax=Aquamicrobium soli TaxID=1811518 RepID=A0ABV7K9S4_9HYPH
MSMSDIILPSPGKITNLAGIPAALRIIPQWILWKPVKRGNKITKTPVWWQQPFGDAINAHAREYWGMFDQVVAAMRSDEQGRFGIGLVLDDTGIICLDFDDHADDDKEAVALGAEYASDALGMNPTYAERSLQGGGRHLFYRATLPHDRVGGVIEQLNLEIYARQFIAITGNALPGSTHDVRNGQSLVDSWNLPPPVASVGSQVATTSLGRALDLSDADVIQTLMVRRHSTFMLLSSQNDFADRSDTFMKIVGDLDKITGDPKQIDRIIRKSPCFKNGYNRERYERDGKWLAKQNCASMLEYWVRDARRDNTESIPFTLYVSPEERERLNSIMATTLAYDAKVKVEKALADASRTIADLPKADPSALPAAATDYLIRDANKNPIGFDYPSPHDPWAMFDPPELPMGLLPPVIESFARERADIIGCDESGLAMSALTVCAAAITDRIKIKMKRHDHWRESTRIWLALVGNPSIKKSPIIKEASAPLDKIEADNRYRYKEAVKAYEMLEKEEKTKVSPPILRRRIIEDTTIEALQNVLNENMECVLCRRDELGSWFGAMDRYSGGGRGASADRGFWLQSYNGGSYFLDRVGRGNKFVEYLSVNMLGGIQPEVLKKVYKETEDDGTMQRLFPVILRSGGIGRDAPSCGTALADYHVLVRTLYNLTGVDINGGTIETATVHFSDGAQRIFDEVRAWTAKLQAVETINSKLATAIGKWDGVFGRLALLFHLIENATVPHVGDGPRQFSHLIPEQTARNVWEFMKVFLLQHLLAFHKNVMGTSDMQDDVEATAEFLLASGKARVSLRDIQRGVQRKDSTHESLIAAMRQLEQYGWVDQVENTGRKDSLAWFVNAECHRRFAAKAQAVTARRAAAREAIEEATAIRRAQKSQTS